MRRWTDWACRLAAIALTAAILPVSGAGASDRQAQRTADRLAIMEKLQLYSLLHDGDGVSSNTHVWAETVFTPDATFQVVWPDGSRMFAADPRGLIGRDAILGQFGGAMPAGGKFAVRHVIGAPVFDRLTDDEAETRTSEYVLRGPAIAGNAEPPPGAGAPGSVDSYVFHDRWRKEADGQWRKSASLIYCTLNCRPVIIGPGNGSRE